MNAAPLKKIVNNYGLTDGKETGMEAMQIKVTVNHSIMFGSVQWAIQPYGDFINITPKNNWSQNSLRFPLYQLSWASFIDVWKHYFLVPSTKLMRLSNHCIQPIIPFRYSASVNRIKEIRICRAICGATEQWNVFNSAVFVTVKYINTFVLKSSNVWTYTASPFPFYRM